MRQVLVFNIERIGASALRAQQRHDTRSGGDLKNVDQQRTHLNRVLFGSGRCVEDVNDLMKSRDVKVRKDNEAPFTRVVISASPEYLKDAGNREKFVADSMEFLQETWGDGLAYAVLHMDETTPHIHAVVVPLVQSKRGLISSHHTHPATRGLNSYERLRRSCACRLQLGYGSPGTKAVSEKMGQVLIEADLILAHARSKAAKEKADLEKEREDLEQERALLNRERSVQTARARALTAIALEIDQAKLAEKAKTMIPVRTSAQGSSRGGIIVPDRHLRSDKRGRERG